MKASREFRAMGTSWWIACDVPSLLPEAETLVRSFEGRLSRFVPDSALSLLNRERSAVCPTLAAVTRVALRLRAATGGAFDPTLGARLAALGYDRSFDHIEPARGSLPMDLDPLPTTTAVVVEGDRVTLDGPGDLDLGGIAKGWTVDRVLERLVAGDADAALVDGGGDLRGVGRPWPIGVGDGLVVPTSAGAIATSSTRRRRWRDPAGRERHHILDPRAGLPSATTLDVATVIAPDTATADALATALLSGPPNALARLMPDLQALGAHALVCDREGRWWMTPHAPIEPSMTSESRTA